MKVFRFNEDTHKVTLDEVSILTLLTEELNSTEE